MGYQAFNFYKSPYLKYRLIHLYILYISVAINVVSTNNTVNYGNYKANLSPYIKQNSGKNKEKVTFKDYSP